MGAYLNNGNKIITSISSPSILEYRALNYGRTTLKQVAFDITIETGRE